MPTITPVQHAKISEKLERVRSNPATVQESIAKGDTNAASQAVLDHIFTIRPALNGKIEGAAPTIFNQAQKDIIIANAALLFAELQGAEV